jgi:ribosomal-protein-alanine N-acetyltransferase
MQEIEREVPTSSNWSHGHYQGLFRTADRGGPKYFVLVAEDLSATEPEAKFAVASRVVAYLAAHSVEKEWELHYLVVARACQRRGVGTLLLNELISQARAEGGGEILLEVRESNLAARSLYERAGFQEHGSRKNYYNNPVENAILYRLSLG